MSATIVYQASDLNETLRSRQIDLTVDIIGTGSSGNAVLIDGSILIDIGMSYSKLSSVLKSPQLAAVLVTHCHGDHLHMSTLARIAKERPELARSSVWLNAEAVERVASKKSEHLAQLIAHKGVIDVEFDVTVHSPFTNSSYRIQTSQLYHDVENYAFVITKTKSDGSSTSIVHVTDTAMIGGGKLEDVFDVLLVEGNHDLNTLLDNLVDPDFKLCGDCASEAQHAKHVRDGAMQIARSSRHSSIQDFEQYVRTHSHDNSVAFMLHESGSTGLNLTS